MNNNIEHNNNGGIKNTNKSPALQGPPYSEKLKIPQIV